jgi:hypothetical protein
MRIVGARRVLAADKRGSSWPVLVETDEGLLFTKLRGAAQGTGALVAEIIVAALAESLGLRVPERSLVQFGEAVESADQNDELADLLRASAGINLGFAYLEDAVNFAPATDAARVTQQDAAAILWLDGLVTNPDRTAHNPNLLWRGDDLWLIDHGAALGFQYALPAIDATTPRRPYSLREPHIFQTIVPDLAPWDASFTARITPAAIEQAVGGVPNEFLDPLVAADGAETLEARRATYVDYFARRLTAPRPFLVPVVAPPNEQRRRGRPAWISRQ